MASFLHDDVMLAFDDLAPEGDGGSAAVVLVHGFASNRDEGWRRTGWTAALQARGARCVAIDQRGHGQSAKPHDPVAYAPDAMARDVLALMDHLGLRSADLVGYSLGARTALTAAELAPERVGRLVLGGVGARWLEPQDPLEAEAHREAMAAAMLAEDPEAIEAPLLRSFRQFADEQGEDRRALAACAAAPGWRRPTPEALVRLPMPVLVVAGARDRTAGAPEPLAKAFADGRAATVPGCDHFSAIPHPLTKAAVFDFFDGVLESDDDPFARSF
jgi:pimeloyl-ACP methyl ester carboxylesterase